MKWSDAGRVWAILPLAVAVATACASDGKVLTELEGRIEDLESKGSDDGNRIDDLETEVEELKTGLATYRRWSMMPAPRREERRAQRIGLRAQRKARPHAPMMWLARCLH